LKIKSLFSNLCFKFEEEEVFLFEILKKEELAPEVFLMEISAPQIAQKAVAGQFFVLRVDEKGERIPLTIADFDKKKGTITMVFQVVGLTTKKLSRLAKGKRIRDLVGPMGKPTHIKKYGRVVIVGGGVGAAAAYPVARELKKAGNYVITIQGAKSAQYLILEDWLLSVSDELHITTDDGSKGRKGFVTDALKDLLEKEAADLVFAVGPAIMMKFVSLTTKPFAVKTIVSLNPIMVDATGMCGSCRVEVGGKTYFACVDGPDFDGHEVNWELLLSRQRFYYEEEKKALEVKDA
jgi:ferredoxin--NADP+ reductase